MTDTQGSSTPDGTSPPSTGSDEGTIRRVVSEALDGLFASGRADVQDAPVRSRGAGKSGAAAADQAANIDGQVQAAIRAAKDAEVKDAKEAALLKRIDELEAKAKGTEQPPVEYRRITRFLWGDR